MHYQSAVVYRLNCHLENMQSQVFSRGAENAVLNNPERSKLIAWFYLNEVEHQARKYLYTEIPQHYTWDGKNKRWNERKIKVGHRIISRLYTVNPKNIELFHPRLLLLHTRGATAYEDLRRNGPDIYATFHDACVARGLTESDNQWKMALEEVVATKSPKQIRQMFAFIVALNNPTSALELWDSFKESMSEGYVRINSPESALNKALLDISESLVSHNTSCAQAGLPEPSNIISDSGNGSETDPNERAFEESYLHATTAQREIIDEVIAAMASDDPARARVFYLDAPAGCGKTYVQETVRKYMQSQSRECIVACYTGIAASLIKGGRTLHNVFKLAVPLMESSVPDITAQSAHAEWLRKCELLIVDKASMVPSLALTIIDRLLRDLTKINRPFGGKVVFLSGDFRQTLPVVPHGGRALTVEACIKKNWLWKEVRCMTP